MADYRRRLQALIGPAHLSASLTSKPICPCSATGSVIGVPNTSDVMLAMPSQRYWMGADSYRRRRSGSDRRSSGDRRRRDKLLQEEQPPRRNVELFANDVAVMTLFPFQHDAGSQG
jgi:hypothetical protein